MKFASPLLLINNSRNFVLFKQFQKWVVIAVLLMAGCFCFWQAGALSTTRVANYSDSETVNVSFEQSPRFAPVTQAIDTIRVGQRVWLDGGNPTEAPDLRFGDEVDRKRWRKMILHCPKSDGSSAQVEMLRPLAWILEREVVAGGQVNVEVPECGISGMAQVEAVEECPPIDQGRGRTVTATFHHSAADIIDVEIEGLDSPIGTTPNHMFWSETKLTFVPAEELRPGDEVRTLGRLAQVTSVTSRGPPAAVFNIEVNVDHVYLVGKAGVLVHNTGQLCPKGNRVAFSLTKHMDDFVDEVGEASGKTPFRYQDFERVESLHPDRLARQIDNLMDDAGIIDVNLTGMDDLGATGIDDLLDLGEAGPELNNVTNWEVFNAYTNHFDDVKWWHNGGLIDDIEGWVFP